MDKVNINLYVAWIGILLGIVFGMVQGMFFHKDEWLGGYGSWRRRIMRLGHISLFGIAIINAFFVFTVFFFEIEEWILLPSRLLIIGAITMPLICYLSAFKKFFRNLFFIPVLSVLLGVALFIFGGLFR
jgi:hypothetical protein